MMNQKIKNQIKRITGNICAPTGYTATGLEAGFKNQGKDLALIYSEVPCATASVYTQNQAKGAPILVTQANSADGKAQAIIVNSGNANTCNPNGMEIAQETCQLVASELGISADDVIVASTGVIGQPLAIEPFQKSMPYLVESLHETGGNEAAEAILTTDTSIKELAVEFELVDGTKAHMGGIAKGSGMIHPNMATMLGFVTTDVEVDSNLMQDMLSEVVSETFNMISVDGDTSTNDMVSMLANGKAGNAPIEKVDEDNFQIVKQALYEICEYLAIEIAKDGEGATTLITCNVFDAASKEQAQALGKSIISSSLVKAAVYGRDANVGRLLCAVGNSKTTIDWQKVDIYLRGEESASICVCEAGSIVPFDEIKAFEILGTDELFIDIHVYDGEEQATAWGCDLTYDYVKINADYRT